MTMQETRRIWTGTLVHVQASIVDGHETVTALIRQGPAGAATYQGLPVRATGAGLAATRALLREGREVCLLGTITADAFQVIAPAIAPEISAAANRRLPIRAEARPQESGRILSLARRRTPVEEVEILAGFA